MIHSITDVLCFMRMLSLHCTHAGALFIGISTQQYFLLYRLSKVFWVPCVFFFPNYADPGTLKITPWTEQGPNLAGNQWERTTPWLTHFLIITPQWKMREMPNSSFPFSVYAVRICYLKTNIWAISTGDKLCQCFIGPYSYSFPLQTVREASDSHFAPGPFFSRCNHWM